MVQPLGELHCYSVPKAPGQLFRDAAVGIARSHVPPVNPSAYLAGPGWLCLPGRFLPFVSGMN